MNRRAPIIAAILALVALPLIAATISRPPHLSGGNPQTLSSEEFVGPMAGWQDVTQSPCNATGDGSTDDTAAIQTCLNNIGMSNPVLYFPAGTYKISNTLYLVGQQYLNIYGADPNTTIIKWINPSPPSNTFTGTLSGSARGGSCCYISTLTVPGGTPNLIGRWITGSSIPSGAVAYVTRSTGTNQYQIAGQDGFFDGTFSMTATAKSMLYMGSTAFTKVDRITFDANSQIDIGIDENWDSNNYFPSGDEYADTVIKNAYWGFMCGGSDGGCSEVNLVRTKFLNNTVAVQTVSANAVNVWCWNCTIFGNSYGLTSLNTNPVHGSMCNGNTGCSGAFSAINSLFQNNGDDISWANVLAAATFMGNYSSGSSYFVDASAGNYPEYDGIVIKGNQIVNTGSALSLKNRESGPALFLGNTVYTSPTASNETYAGVLSTPTAGPAVNWAGGGAADIMSKDNTFNKGSGTCSSSAPAYSGAGRCHSINDTINTGLSPPSAPTLPGVPPRACASGCTLTRNVYEASASGSGTACLNNGAAPCSAQTAICLAATGSSGFSAGHCTGTVAASRNAVHLRAGSYAISTTLDVPANADIQVIGDGWNTILSPSLSGVPTVRVNGPSHVVLNNLQIDGSQGSTVDALEINTADQVGAKVWADQLLFSNAMTTSIYSDHLTNTTVEVHKSSFLTAGNLNDGANAFNVFFCVSVNPFIPWTLTGSGSLLVQGCWNDGGGTQPIASITGTGTFSHVAGHSGTSHPGGTLVSVTGFSGNALIGPGDYTPDDWSAGTMTISPTAGATVQGLGIGSSSTSYWNTSGAAGGTTQFLNSFQYNPPASAPGNPLTEVPPATPNTSFINAALNQFSTTSPTVQSTGSPGVTAVELYWLGLFGGRYGIHVIGNAQINTLDSINGAVANAYGTWTFGPCLTPPTGANPPGPFGCYAYVKLNGTVVNRISQVGCGGASQIVVQGGEVTFLTCQNDRIQYGWHNYDVYGAGCPMPHETLPCPTPGTPPTYSPPYTPSPDGTTITSSPGSLTTLDGIWTNNGGGSSYIPTLNGLTFADLGGQSFTSMRVDCNGYLFGLSQGFNLWNVIIGLGRVEYQSSFPTCPIVVNVAVTPNPALVSGSIPGPQVTSGTPIGTVVATIILTMSDGSPFSGSLSLNTSAAWLGTATSGGACGGSPPCIVTTGVPGPSGAYLTEVRTTPGPNNYTPGPATVEVIVP